MGDTVDLCLVACRRPDLLEKTLTSFQTNLLSDLRIGAVLANVDPFMGTEAEGARTVAVIKSHFPTATVFTPPEPGFTAAVRRVWAASSAGLVFHLEDDWLLEEHIDPARLISRLTGDVKAVSLLSAEHGTRGQSQFSESLCRRKILGLPIGRIREARFNTSPGLFDGPFVRALADLMRTDLDPEKQMRRKGGNRALYSLTQTARCAFFKAADGAPIARDIGREWRDQRHLQKVLVDGQSLWISEDRAAVG